MVKSHVLTVAGYLVAILLGLGVVGSVWQQSASPSPPTTRALVGELQSYDPDGASMRCKSSATLIRRRRQRSRPL